MIHLSINPTNKEIGQTVKQTDTHTQLRRLLSKYQRHPKQCHKNTDYQLTFYKLGSKTHIQ